MAIIKPEPTTKTFTIVYHKTSSSSITDLTGTKWVINDYLSDLALADMSYKINFTSNSTNFDFISFTSVSIKYRQTSTSIFVEVYSNIGSGGSND